MTTKTAPSVVSIDFHGDQIVTFQHEGQAYVAMRRVVENLGLAWQPQHRKLTAESAKYQCHHIVTVDSAGREYPMLAIPAAKLALWLASINPNKVPDATKREKLELYQSESAIALHDYWTRGFAIDRKRLGEDEVARDDLASEVRKLRLSDKALYKKLTDTIAATSTDYQAAKLIAPKRIPALFIRIQDTFHVAVTGMTAQDLVIKHADGTKPMVGMVSYAGPLDRIKVADVRTGKNYLEAIPFRKLEILYEQLILYAEHKVLSGERMTLEGWAEQIDKLLVHNGYQPWKLYNGYKGKLADETASRELAIYNKRLKAEAGSVALR